MSITERPVEVYSRLAAGYLEGDLIIGKNHKSALSALLERTTQFTILVPVKGKEAKTVREAFAEVFSEIDP